MENDNGHSIDGNRDNDSDSGIGSASGNPARPDTIDDDSPDAIARYLGINTDRGAESADGSNGSEVDGSRGNSGERADDSGNSEHAGIATSGASRKRGRPAGSRNRVRTGDSEETDGSNEDSARVKTPRRTRASGAESASKVIIPATTRELINDSWTALYWLPAQVTGIREVELNESEADVLTSRTETLIKSLGTKRAKASLALLDKYAPGVSLAVAVAIITLPKVRLIKTHNARMNNVTPHPATANNNNLGARGSNTNSITPEFGNIVTVDGNGGQPITIGREQPLTAADLDFIGGSGVS